MNFRDVRKATFERCGTGRGIAGCIRMAPHEHEVCAIDQGHGPHLFCRSCALCRQNFPTRHQALHDLLADAAAIARTN